MTIQARFSGTCHDCGERWQPGDLIRCEATEPGSLPDWCHAVCPESFLDKRPGETTCTTCWLIHPEEECDR